MLKIVKYAVICLLFFFTSVFSCSEKKVEFPKTECEQIKDIVTDCMGLHRGAFDYIKNCGDAYLEEIKLINTCDEILNYIENKE